MNKNSLNKEVNSNMNSVVELNTLEGDNMTISEIYDEIEEIIEEKLVEFKYTDFEVFDNELESRGWIVIDMGDGEFQDEIISIVSSAIDEIKGVEISIDEMPSFTVGIYHFGFDIKISGVTTPRKPFKGDNMDILHKLECDEEFYELLNNVEYCSICKKEKEEEVIMDNAIVTDAFDSYGKIFEDIVFEDEIEAEIGGDWYCRASGGAFSSSQDYWNYILG